MDKFWTKFWPKNVIIQILQSLIFLNFYSSDRNDYNRRRQGGLSISEYPESGIYGRHRQNIGYADYSEPNDYSEPIEPLSLDTAEGTEGGTIS